MLSRKFQFYLGIINTFPAVFYIFFAFSLPECIKFLTRLRLLRNFMHSGRENAKKNVETAGKVMIIPRKNFYLLDAIITTCRKLICIQ